MNRRRIARVFAALLLGLPAPVAAEWLAASASSDPVFAPPGSTILVRAALQNLAGETLYLNGISVDLPDELLAPDPLGDFSRAAPESLLAGEGWEGPVLRITLGPGAPVTANQRMDLNFVGGAHPYDDQILTTLTLTLDDSTAVSATPNSPPASVERLAVAPNPARGGTVVSFSLTMARPVSIGVFDLRGSLVRNLYRGTLPAGSHTRTWDGLDNGGHRAPRGFYFIRLNSALGVRQTKLVLVD